MKAIAGALADHPTIEVLNLQCCQLGAEGALSFATALASNLALGRLNLASCGINDQQTQVLAQGLVRNGTLKKLELDFNMIGSKGAEALLGALDAGNSSLSLSLRENPIPEQLLSVLLNHKKSRSERCPTPFLYTPLEAFDVSHLPFSALPAAKSEADMTNYIMNNQQFTLAPSLNQLTISTPFFTTDHAETLGLSLLNNSTLKTLWFKVFPVDELSLRNIARGLLGNSGVNTLYLQYNAIDDMGTMAIMDAIGRNPSCQMKKLTLGENVSDMGAKSVGELLRSNQMLEKLSLGSNISEIGIGYICEAMKVNSKVNELDLSRNRCDVSAVVCIAGMIKETKSLNHLCLQGMPMKGDAMKEMGEALKVNASLIGLNLASCGIDDEGALYLANGVAQNSTLTTLELDFNEISPDVVQQIRNILKHKPNMKLSLKSQRKSTKKTENKIDALGGAQDVKTPISPLVLDSGQAGGLEFKVLESHVVTPEKIDQFVSGFLNDLKKETVTYHDTSQHPFEPVLTHLPPFPTYNQPLQPTLLAPLDPFLPNEQPTAINQNATPSSVKNETKMTDFDPFTVQLDTKPVETPLQSLVSPKESDKDPFQIDPFTDTKPEEITIQKDPEPVQQAIEVQPKPVSPPVQVEMTETPSQGSLEVPSDPSLSPPLEEKSKVNDFEFKMDPTSNPSQASMEGTSDTPLAPPLPLEEKSKVDDFEFKMGPTPNLSHPPEFNDNQTDLSGGSDATDYYPTPNSSYNGDSYNGDSYNGDSYNGDYNGSLPASVPPFPQPYRGPHHPPFYPPESRFFQPYGGGYPPLPPFQSSEGDAPPPFYPPYPPPQHPLFPPPEAPTQPHYPYEFPNFPPPPPFLQPPMPDPSLRYFLGTMVHMGRLSPNQRAEFEAKAENLSLYELQICPTEWLIKLLDSCNSFSLPDKIRFYSQLKWYNPQ
eukprot:TRINITY_DN1549_c0_g1_i1.p1 TRINITY_DN1549_c0_g1~~TRINITY_DN1549_c0_g1_i1.p1  ORF type:complete len:1100 (-),score=276.73 TRINITY_DN1549_c0_g1_i1:13-2817(-)